MQHTPYTSYVIDALMAAQVGIGLLVFALLWFHGVGERGDRLDRAAWWLLLTALGLVVTALTLPPLLQQLGAPMSPDFSTKQEMFATALGTLAALCSRRIVPIAWAFAAEAVLYRLPTWFPQSEGEIVAAHLVWISILVFVLRPRPAWLATARAMKKRKSAAVAPADAPPVSAVAVDTVVAEEEVYTPYQADRQDLALFAIATLTATIVAVFVLIRRGGSGDEWAYTWQSSVFAHGRAYSDPAPCGSALQSFYVFTSMGRSFSQYTPGWPLLMAPFTALKLTWLASPVMSGLVAVAVARLSRRAGRSILERSPYATPVTEKVVPAAGWIGGLTVSLGTTYLLNAGSRYPHVAVMALFAWSIEALCRLVDAQRTFAFDTPGSLRQQRRQQWIWGTVLGVTVALTGAARPSDGACLDLFIGIVFLVDVLRRRIGWRGFVATAVSVSALGGFCLVILRLQLGTWFTTGYSLNDIIHPWNVIKYDWPLPEQWKYSIPLATGEYCWFPCSMAVGIVGLCAMRGAAARIAWSTVGVLPLLLYYSFIDMGTRGRDWGYGPRYALILVVPMALGTAAALAPLAAAATATMEQWIRARARAGSGRPGDAIEGIARRGGPWVLAASAMLIGTLRIVPLIWPGIHAFITSHGKVQLAVERENLHHAVVFVGVDTSEWDVMDATENMPFEFFHRPDVVIAIDRDPNLTQCVKEAFPGRSYWRARRSALDVSLQPF
jgi:hypothetical protein